MFRIFLMQHRVKVCAAFRILNGLLSILNVYLWLTNSQTEKGSSLPYLAIGFWCEIVFRTLWALNTNGYCCELNYVKP